MPFPIRKFTLAQGRRSATGLSQAGESGGPADGKSRLAVRVTPFVALPRPAPQRRVFRPARRVSWVTRIFVVLVFVLAVAAVTGFLTQVLPAQVASLARLEAGEVAAARTGAANVGTSTTTLWTDLGTTGSIGLPDDQLRRDLALAQSTEKAAEDALGHIKAAQAYMAQADGIPFQFHAPAFIATDRPALLHLEKALNAAVKLAHGADLQLSIARHLAQDSTVALPALTNSLTTSAWAAASRASGSLQAELKTQESAAADPETLLDPLWIKWTDAINAYAITAQQYSLAASAGQAQNAQLLGRALAAQADQIPAAAAAARANAAAWQKKTIQPLLDVLARELAAGS